MRCANGSSHDAPVLSPAQGRSFTRRSAHHQRGCPFLDLTMTEPFKRRQVEFARIVEWRRQRRRIAGEPQNVTLRCGHD
jgi:hypothetical protein